MRTLKPTLTTMFLFSAAALGCAGSAAEDDPSAVATSDLESDNGLSSINGLSATNGLSSINGLSATNGLASTNGLSSTNGLMTTAGGRTTVTYLVRCALPATASIVKQDQYGMSYTFHGEIGVAPQWQTGACDINCQQLVSACMLAHINTSGIHVPLWLDAQVASIGWGLNSLYPNEEGSFFGNIFISPPKAYYCYGAGAFVSPAPGRIGSVQTNPPYVNAFAASDGLCATAPHCAPADKPYQTNGFKTCNGGGLNYPAITVWRGS